MRRLQLTTTVWAYLLLQEIIGAEEYITVSDQQNTENKFPAGCRWSSSERECGFMVSHDIGCGSGYELVNLEPETCDGLTSGFVPCCAPCPANLIVDMACCQGEHCDLAKKQLGEQYIQDNECMYEVGTWSICHSALLTNNRTDSLISGPSSCDPVRIISQTCKYLEFLVEEELATDRSPTQMTSTTQATVVAETNDTYPITPLNTESTMPTMRADIFERELADLEAQLQCRYNVSDWSECNLSTNTRTRTRQKIRGPESCRPVKEEERSCRTRDGREKCFYGKWSRWSHCDESTLLQKRFRIVLFGESRDCDRTLKYKSCAIVDAGRRRRHRSSPHHTT